MKTQDVSARGIRFSIERDGHEVAHAYLYIMHNDLHTEPFGLLEDLSVHEEHRSEGIGNELLLAIIKTAKMEGCYKLIATSRESRTYIHKWYTRTGFKEYGKEFRMDF